jgi:hypothetical protein
MSLRSRVTPALVDCRAGGREFWSFDVGKPIAAVRRPLTPAARVVRPAERVDVDEEAPEL